MVELIITFGIGLIIYVTIKITKKKIVKPLSKKTEISKIEKKIYKEINLEILDRHEIYELVGFVGVKFSSSNNLYFIYSNSGQFENEKWVNGKIAVFYKRNLLFTKELEKPYVCAISSEGTSICTDSLSQKELSGKFYVYDKNGNELFNLKTQSNLGCCSISENGEITAIETHNSFNEDSNSLFIIDIKKRLVINKIKRPISFIKTKINSETRTIELITRKEIIFKIDFYGNHLNFTEYKKQLINKGSTNEVLLYFSKLPREIKFLDKDYLHTLNKATINKDSYVSLRNEKVYREIGEFHETLGNIEKTIEYWEKAIEINPKVGIKKKLNNYKKNCSQHRV